MSKEAESKLIALQQQVAADAYEIDARVVAAAILSRPSGLALLASRLGDATGPNRRGLRLARGLG